MSLRSPQELQQNPLVRRAWEGLGRPHGYVAGGFVRDHLLGRHSVDLDLSLVGTAEETETPARRLAAELGTRAHLLGTSPRCVWRIETPDLKVELWPLGSLTLDDDILRRDFTCNALVWQLPDGPLIDRVGGLDDLRSGRLAAVSRGNLQDDPVRLLRAPRFLAEIASIKVDHQSRQWIRELSPRLAYAPKARLGYEIMRLLQADGADRGIRAILDFDLFRTSAPSDTVLDGDWLAQHSYAAGRLASGNDHPVPDSIRGGGDGARLAVLFRAWGCPPAAATAEYAWQRRDRLTAIRAAAMMDVATTTADAPAADRRELIFKAGEAFPALLAAAAALDPGGSSRVAQWRKWWAQWTRNGPSIVRPPSLLEIDEIMALTGFSEGPELGAVLGLLQKAQARGEVRSAVGARRWLQERNVER